MLSLTGLRCVLLQVTVITLLHNYVANGKNVSFVPEPIHLTLADLPAPYNTSSANKGPNVIPVPADPEIYSPNGFTVKLYMSGLTTPRYMIYTPTGDLLVSEPDANRVSCLVDTDGDGYPDQRITFADATNGLNRPYGMAFAGGFFYVGSQNETRRYSWIRASRQISGVGESVMTYDSAGHWTRTVVVSPDYERLYIGIGSASNVDIEALPRASVQVGKLDGSNIKLFAHGLRNPIGLAFHPVSKDLYVACQERDGLGDDLVPDYFTRIQQDEYYGWPFAYMSSQLVEPRRRFPNGTSENPELVASTKTPDVLFQSHSAVLDTHFYTGTQFPSQYQNGAFAALHGSWNKNVGTGYKIVFIPFDSTTNRPKGYYEDFVKGFLTNPAGPDTFGRPVGLLVLKDGSLLFTEDGNDRIYQVQYNNNEPTTTTPSNSSGSVLANVVLLCSVLISFVFFYF